MMLGLEIILKRLNINDVRTKILQYNPRSAMFIMNLCGKKIAEEGDFAIYEQTWQNRRKALQNVAKK